MRGDEFPPQCRGGVGWEWEWRQEKLQKETNFVMASLPHSSWTQLGERAGGWGGWTDQQNRGEGMGKDSG